MLKFAQFSKSNIEHIFTVIAVNFFYFVTSEQRKPPDSGGEI